MTLSMSRALLLLIQSHPTSSAASVRQDLHVFELLQLLSSPARRLRLPQRSHLLLHGHAVGTH